MNRDVMLTAAMVGFQEAYARWMTQWSDGADPLFAFPPLAEVLWWACALDEAMWDDDGYETRREADQDGRMMRGVRWARNQTNHALALVTTDDAFKDDPYELVDLRWAKADSLPPEDRPDMVGRARYVGLLEGRSVVDTLDSIRSWLHRSGIFRKWEGEA